MERTPGASSSLCVRAKKQQILVHREWYANHSQKAQCRFAILTYVQLVHKPFGALVYTRLNTIRKHRQKLTNQQSSCEMQTVCRELFIVIRERFAKNILT